MHFTDDPPPPEVLAARPNWRHDFGREGRAGCDESTIYPQAGADWIGAETDYTAGDVWLPGDEERPALIALHDDGTGPKASGITVYAAGGGYWRLQLLPEDAAGNLWRGRFERGKFVSRPENPIRHRWRVWADDGSEWNAAADPAHFPLNYCTRLPVRATGKAVRGRIDFGGVPADWPADDGLPDWW